MGALSVVKRLHIIRFVKPVSIFRLKVHVGPYTQKFIYYRSGGLRVIQAAPCSN